MLTQAANIDDPGQSQIMIVRPNVLIAISEEILFHRPSNTRPTFHLKDTLIVDIPKPTTNIPDSSPNRGIEDGCDAVLTEYQ